MATESLKIVIFLLVDANCDDSVVMFKVSKPGCGLESECGTENFFACKCTHFGIQILDPPLSASEYTDL